MDKDGHLPAFYKEAIQRGSKLSIYFAANAALELGNIYYDQKNYKEAKRYYQICLEMPNSDHKNSIERNVDRINQNKIKK